MNVIGIDTSTDICSVALISEKNSFTENISGKSHSTVLLPMIDRILSKSALKIDDIDLFSVTEGPGSFTGIRIGISTVKGLALTSEKKCIGISTLEAIASTVTDYDGYIIPTIDARRNNVYSALFNSCNGELTRLSDDELVNSDEIKAKYDLETKESYIILGDGLGTVSGSDGSYERVYEYKGKIKTVSLAAAELAVKKYTNNREDLIGLDCDSLHPVYLRKTQAERELNNN